MTPSVTIKAGLDCTISYVLPTAATTLQGLDPWWSAQWHLLNTGQNGGVAGEDLRVLAAWADAPTGQARGAGARVAVIDDAVELTHPDLWPNVLAGQSHSYRAGNTASAWPVPCDPSERHGTAVAGLVAARDDNQQGGRGVAPRASMVAFDALASGNELDLIDALGRDRALNQIYQNSWGSYDDGALHPASAAYMAALEQGLAQGRSGLGSVFVFSAGNGGCFQAEAGVCVSDNVNYDGYVNQRGNIAVCAVDHAGQGPTYSEPGAALLVCAPSAGDSAGLTTAGLQGATRSDFGGTSGAAPQVSGVVALMLAVNPALSWRDVRWILAGTARQNDPSHPGWRTAYGYHFNHQYGFGVVDAAAAVAAARTWTSVGDSRTQKRCGPYSHTLNQPVPDALAGATTQTVSDTLTVADCTISQIEWVEIELSTSHADAGELRVQLLSPNGLESRLADARPCVGTCGQYAAWRFGSMAHLGEPAAGAWRLEVSDRRVGGVGQWLSWRMTVYGH